MQRPDKTNPRDGDHIINQLSIVLRTCSLHQAGNTALLSAKERFRRLLNYHIERDAFAQIDLVGEFFYVNHARVRHSLKYHQNFNYLLTEFRCRELGMVKFQPDLDISHIDMFLDAFMGAKYSETPFDTMDESLVNIQNIQIGKLGKSQGKETDADTRMAVKKAYFNAVSITKGIMTQLKAGEKVSMIKAKRIVKSMVEHLISEDQLLIQMTAIKDYDEYTYHHCVNVSVLSIAIGQKIGLNRTALTDLGLAALFHDIGKTDIPKEVLNKTEKFNDDDWKIMKRHPFYGAREILLFKGIDKTSIQSAVVALQHHMHCNLSGYPQLKEPIKIDFMTRIVAIADQYDAMTSSRVYSRIPYSPDRVLSIMLNNGGIQLDPIILKIFVNLVGVYPIGSLVLMDTREMGLVYKANPFSSSRPKVLIVVDCSGNRIDGFEVDLAEKSNSGKYSKTIVKTLDPNKYRINLAEYFL
ncbi:MAG: HD domain-containing protein [Thermodesulfobacteriota bacterium]|nr:HD domain-containing protein [Thermodesulfobacteriota bacterium]